MENMIIYNVLIENPDSTNLNSFSTLENAYVYFIQKLGQFKIEGEFEVLPKLSEIKNHFNKNYRSHQGYFCLGKNLKHGFWFHLFQVVIDEVKQSPGFSMFEKYEQEKSESEIFNVKQFLLERGFTIKTENPEYEAWNKCIMKLKEIKL
jgi:hypothetical protein